MAAYSDASSARRLGLAATGVAATVMTLAAPGSARADGGGSPPAGGAAVTEVIIATAAAAIATALLLVLAVGHRTGRVGALARMGAWAERRWDVPGWSAFPGLVCGLSLLVALVGMYWDISLHIDQGRDPGPLANPAHYLILFGLFGAFAGGVLAMAMPQGRPGTSAVRITGSWWVPVGGLMLAAASAFALLGFPLDDGWHRLFGQDVTLWGPTHLMLFGGAGLTLIGRSALMVEGEREARSGGGDPPRLIVFQRAMLVGGFLVGLSTFQGEFDFGVPQFQLVFQPLLIGVAAGTALVVARIWAGRGGALLAMAQFVVIRGLLALLVGPGLGEAVPHFPLYAVEALLVELVAWRLGTRRPLAFGALSGALIGTIGIASEWGWSHVWMPIPWPSSLLPEGAILGFGGALAGGLLGALIGTALASDELRMPRRAGGVALAAGAAILGMVAYGLATSPLPQTSASVSLRDVRTGPEREVAATITIRPASAADDPKWLTVTSWQGGKLRIDELERVGPGVFRTTERVPAHGGWKSMLRLHTGDSIAAVPIYLPEDKAIPAKEVPAESRFTRPFVADKEILQREAKDAPAGIATVAYLIILGIALAFFGVLAAGLRRLASSAAAGGPPDQRAQPRADAPARRPRRAVPV